MVINKLEQNKLRASMNLLIKNFRDESLFGLSNSIDPIKSQKDNSALLKLESDCCAKEKFIQ